MKRFREFLNEGFIDYQGYDFNSLVTLIKDDILVVEEEYEELVKQYEEEGKQITTLNFNRELSKMGFDVDDMLEKLAVIVTGVILKFEESKRRMVLNSLEDFITKKIEGEYVYLVSHQIIDMARYKINK
jgi:hypothetical protein